MPTRAGPPLTETVETLLGGQGIAKYGEKTMQPFLNGQVTTPGFSIGGFLGGLGKGIGDFLGGDPIGGIGDVLHGAFGGGGGTKTPTCPPGYAWDGTQCKEKGVTGLVHRLVPGGETGTMADPVSEILGVQGRQPTASTRRVCGPGWRLATNGLCYPKAMLPAKFRAYQSKRSPVTYSDMRAIQRAARTKGRLERLAKKTGLHVYTTARPACKKRKK